MTSGPLLFCNHFKTVLLAIARTCQYLVDLDLSNCHIINTGSFGILSKLTSLQVSISCSINIPSSLSQFSFYSEIDPSLPWDCYKVSSKLPRNWPWFIQKLPLFFYEMLQILQVCTQGYCSNAPRMPLRMPPRIPPRMPPISEFMGKTFLAAMTTTW